SGCDWANRLNDAGSKLDCRPAQKYCRTVSPRPVQAIVPCRSGSPDPQSIRPEPPVRGWREYAGPAEDGRHAICKPRATTSAPPQRVWWKVLWPDVPVWPASAPGYRQWCRKHLAKPVAAPALRASAAVAWVCAQTAKCPERLPVAGSGG